jgi:hypothetical protein
MSGNTGKMTADAIAFHGPRTILAVRNGEYRFVSEHEPWPEGFFRLAVSYTLSYLRRIAKVNGYKPEGLS